MAFCLFLVSIVVLRRIVSDPASKLVNPHPPPSNKVVGVELQALPPQSLGTDLSKLATALNQWGGGAITSPAPQLSQGENTTSKVAD